MPDGFAVAVTFGKLKHRAAVRGDNRLDEYFRGGDKKERDCRLLAGFKGFEVLRAEHLETAFGDERRRERRSVQFQILMCNKKIPRSLQTSRTEFKCFYVHNLFKANASSCGAYLQNNRACSSCLISYMLCPNAQVEFGKLLFVNLAGAFVHGADGKGVFGEGDYFFNRGFACH